MAPEPQHRVEDFEIGPAREADFESVIGLLEENLLPVAGVREHFKTFIVAKEGMKVVGCAGSETHPHVALLRSLAVLAGYRNAGLGRRLVRELLDRLAAHGVREFYLLTLSAERFFKKRGFKTIDRDEVHPQVLGSPEFQGACPSTAVCMKLVMS